MKPTAKFAWLRRRGVVVALLFGYLMFALITVEQGRTIAAQRMLIRQLFQDSIELSAVRVQQHMRRR